MLGCLRPLLFVFVAPLVLGLAVLIYYSAGDEEAAKTLARSRPPPAAVDIGKFDPARDSGPAREAIVLAQANLRMRIDRSRKKDGETTDRYVMVPLYALDAKAVDEPALGILVRHGRLSIEELDRITTGNGPIGPILKIDGELLHDYDVRRGDEGDFDGKVLIKRTPVYIDPYPDGRAAALAPSSSGRDIAWFFGWVAGIFFFGGIAAEWIRVRRLRAETDGYHGSSY